MTLKAKFYYLTSPRKVRGFATAIMALIGLLGVVVAVVFTQESSAAMLSLTQQLSDSPLVALVELVKSLI